MYEWAVYSNDKFVGRVYEDSEDEAYSAAIRKFKLNLDAAIRLEKRT